MTHHSNSYLLYNTVNNGDLTNKNIGRKQGFRLKESGQGNRKKSFNDIRPQKTILQVDNESLSSWLPNSESLVAFMCISSFLSTKLVARMNDIN